MTANDFGTASGEFAIPTGRALGVWRVATSLGGADARVHIEEYKRPTFETTLKDPAEPLRLNRPARLTGEARYYFGLPVAAGNVRWRVTRTPQLPVVVLVARLGAARADRDDRRRNLGARSRRHVHPRLHAVRRRAARRRTQRDDVHLHASTPTHPTRGERRDRPRGHSGSASSRWRRAWTCRAASSAPGRSPTITVVRTNLDGVPRAGRGSWRIVRLEQPAAAALPADLPPDPRRSPAPKAACGRQATLCVRAGTPPTIPRASSRAGRAAPRSRAATSPMTRRGWRASRSPVCPPARTGSSMRRATSSAPTSRFPGSSSSRARRRRSPWRPCCSPRRARFPSARRRGSSRPRACPASPSPSRSTATAGPSSGAT